MSHRNQEDYRLLRGLARYSYATRPQLQRVLYPKHRDGRTTRRRINKLYHLGELSKTPLMVPSEAAGAGCPVYYLAKQGTESLAAYYDDERFLYAVTRRPRMDLLHHWLNITDTHIAIDKAMVSHPEIKIRTWRNEWETVNKDQSPSQHYFLQTNFEKDPTPLSCSPDFAFVLDDGTSAIVVFGEQDRNTSGVKQVANKAKGYAAMYQRQHHKVLFPNTHPTFFVLTVTTTPGRRKLLAKAVHEKQDLHPGERDLWLFVTLDDLTPDNFPYADVFYDSSGSPGPLLTRCS